MAGNSKWANIKHRKAAQDAKRGKLFTRLIRELTVAARAGGPSPEDNPRLRAALDKALSANMTRDTIDRAVARGAGTDEADNLEEVVYEGYGPGGVAIYVETMTDNRNRTVSDVRHAFTKHGGNLGTSGSVAYLFDRVGNIRFEAGIDEDQLLEVALDAGAEDVIIAADGSAEVRTDMAGLVSIKEALEQAGLMPANAELEMIASTSAALDADGARSIIKLVDTLEELDDVQNVYSNAEISDEILDSLE